MGTLRHLPQLAEVFSRLGVKSQHDCRDISECGPAFEGLLKAMRRTTHVSSNIFV